MKLSLHYNTKSEKEKSHDLKCSHGQTPCAHAMVHGAMASPREPCAVIRRMHRGWAREFLSGQRRDLPRLKLGNLFAKGLFTLYTMSDVLLCAYIEHVRMTHKHMYAAQSQRLRF